MEGSPVKLGVKTLKILKLLTKDIWKKAWSWLELVICQMFSVKKMYRSKVKINFMKYTTEAPSSQWVLGDPKHCLLLTAAGGWRAPSNERNCHGYMLWCREETIHILNGEYLNIWTKARYSAVLKLFQLLFVKNLDLTKFSTVSIV